MNNDFSPPDVEQQLRGQTQFLWINNGWRPIENVRARSDFGIGDVVGAGEKWRRFAGLLLRLFPEPELIQGIIESEFLSANWLQESMPNGAGSSGKWFVKADHALPVAGSIKARGGTYEVLLHAEALALEDGPIEEDDDREILASTKARGLFGRHRLSAGSTGNTVLSIGIAAAALGFEATVHMSADSKHWRKQRSVDRGVKVFEHAGDFGVAVAAGRSEAEEDPFNYFFDDENSARLSIGYSAAALRLKAQLDDAGVAVDEQHALFVYLPCGVGGAPGGITFGLRHIFGNHAHCFLAEPTASPSMLAALAFGESRSISVRQFGLDNCTEADGLTVPEASQFAVPLIRPLVAGVYTMSDDEMLRALYDLDVCEGIRAEPSAAAAVSGPRSLLSSDAGVQFWQAHRSRHDIRCSTHIVWTTGDASFQPTSIRPIDRVVKPSLGAHLMLAYKTNLAQHR